MDSEQVMLGVDGTLAELHSHSGWFYQPKWDGNRGKAIYDHGNVQIINRRGADWAIYLPELTEALRKHAETTGAETFTIDGEIVAFKDGHTNLRLSNTRCATRNKQIIEFRLRRLIPLAYKVFDIMEWDGTRYEQQPLHYRCSVLKQFLQVQTTRIEPTPTFQDPDECWQDWVINRKEEGIMLKDPESHYIYDRSLSWIKVKARNRATFYVCGYTKGDGKRADTFGALILTDGFGQLRGRCGGGFTLEEAKRILHVLKQATVIDPPFPESDVGLPYTPIKTPMKVEVAYQGNGASEKLRSPQLVRWWTS